MISDLLEDYGYESDRFSLHWVSSAEPDKFVAAVTDVTQKVKALGPINKTAEQAA